MHLVLQMDSKLSFSRFVDLLQIKSSEGLNITDEFVEFGGWVVDLPRDKVPHRVIGDFTFWRLYFLTTEIHCAELLLDSHHLLELVH